jgi:hypothetical protein
VQQSRRVRGVALAGSLMALCLPALAWAPAVLAQDASPAPSDVGIELEPVGEPSAFCGALTAEEASAALGATLTVGSSSDTDCSWDSDFVTSNLSLLVARDAGDFELDAKEIFPDGVEVDVAGRPGWYTEEGLALFVDLGDGMLLTVELFGTPADSIDVPAALTGLASLALPRLDAIPIPTDAPEPSSVGDPVLQALIPPTVGDAEMVVDVYTAADLVADDPDDPGAAASIADLEALVNAHGSTIEDVSFANAYFATETAYGDLFAIRVAGADVAGFQDELTDLVLQLVDPVRTPGTIAGHAVTVVTDGPPATGSPDPSADPFAVPLPPSYVYPSGEVLFIVSADEPQLSQLFELLP